MGLRVFDSKPSREERYLRLFQDGPNTVVLRLCDKSGDPIPGGAILEVNNSGWIKICPDISPDAFDWGKLTSTGCFKVRLSSGVTVGEILNELLEADKRVLELLNKLFKADKRALELQAKIEKYDSIIRQLTNHSGPCEVFE